MKSSRDARDSVSDARGAKVIGPFSKCGEGAANECTMLIVRLDVDGEISGDGGLTKWRNSPRLSLRRVTWKWASEPDDKIAKRRQ